MTPYVQWLNSTVRRIATTLPEPEYKRTLRGILNLTLMTRLGHRPGVHVAVAKLISTPIKAPVWGARCRLWPAVSIQARPTSAES